MSSNIFTKVPFTKIKSNVFDLSHDVKLSLKMGDLVPIMCTECVPGDKFNISCESLLRFAPLVAPVMHRMDVTMHYFFVPYRILWPAWENYVTGDTAFSVPAAFPTITFTGATATTWKLADYLGIPANGTANTEELSAMPFGAYQAIYNEYYRDENLVPAVPYQLNDGAQASVAQLITLRKRAWEHDYFTSCLPWTQKGAPVDIPFGTFNDVKVVVQDSAQVAAGNTFFSDTGTAGPAVPGAYTASVEFENEDEFPQTTMAAKTSDLTPTATNITDLRRAFKLQEWLEKAARGGTRYIEFIKSMFGVMSSDKRLQRPEYITGVKSPVVISEVLNTTGTPSAPQGDMAGHGVSVTSGNYGHYYCEEHGLIMGIMSVTPKTAYQQGLPKIFTKINDRYDFYWEQFAHIGEQAVWNKELYAFNGASGENAFGYTPRYAEYKFEPNRVAGDFRTTLDFWHLGRQFASAPALNQAFIECVPDTRIFAVEDGTDYLWAHVYNKIKASRKMAYYGEPRF